MRIECAWCGFIIEESEDGPTSHGICPGCKKKLLLKRKNDREEKVKYPYISYWNRESNSKKED